MQRVKGALKPFGELKNGDAFLHKGFLLMKIQPIIDRDGDTWNAVDLENGRECCFRDRTVIEAVAAIVKIEEVIEDENNKINSNQCDCGFWRVND